MKTCILVTSHLNTSKKVKEALDNLTEYSTFGLPLVYTGNFPLPESIQSLSDYSFFIKENPISIRLNCAYVSHFNKELGGHCKYTTKFRDYGSAHLHQIKEGLKICDSLGYDYVVHLNYDVAISKNSFNTFYEEILNNPQHSFLNRNTGTSQHYNGGYETILWGAKPKLMYQVIEQYLPHYINFKTIDPNAPNDWICEDFFAFITNAYDPTVSALKAIQKKVNEKDKDHYITSDQKTFSFGRGVDYQTIRQGPYRFNVYWNKLINKYVIKSINGSIPESLVVTVNGKKLVGTKLKEEDTTVRGFIIDYEEGEYFVENEFLFKSDEDFKQYNYMEIYLKDDKNGDPIWWKKGDPFPSKFVSS